VSDLGSGHPHTALIVVGLHLANVAVGAIALTAWIGVLPPIAAVFGIVLYGIQILESDTVRTLFKRLRGRGH
jgi:hypothetical protein